MNAGHLIAQAEAAGLSLVLEPPDTVRVLGPAETRQRIVPELRANKGAILSELHKRQMGESKAGSAPSLSDPVEEAVAEREARSAMRVYDLLVAMGPDQAPKSVTMIGPGCDLAEARRIATGQFGADRVLEIRPRGYSPHPCPSPLYQVADP